MVLLAPPFLVSLLAQMGGGFSPVDDVSPGSHCYNLAAFALPQLTARSNSLDVHVLTFDRVISAQSQVVAGTNYRIAAQVSRQAAPAGILTLTIWEQPWTNTLQVTQASYSADGSNAAALDLLGGLGLDLDAAAFAASERQCTGGKVWHDCGSGCEPTCAEQNMACFMMCVPKCECPFDKPLLEGGRCVAASECPAADAAATSPPPLSSPPSPSATPARLASYNCFTREMWTPEKSAWCCTHKNLGCPAAPLLTPTSLSSPPPPAASPARVTVYNCFTREMWSPEKTAWCCAHRHLGCPAAADSPPSPLAVPPPSPSPPPPTPPPTPLPSSPTPLLGADGHGQYHGGAATGLAATRDPDTKEPAPAPAPAAVQKDAAAPIKTALAVDDPLPYVVIAVVLIAAIVTAASLRKRMCRAAASRARLVDENAPKSHELHAPPAKGANVA